MNFSCPTKVGDLPFTPQNGVVFGQLQTPYDKCLPNELGFIFGKFTEDTRIMYRLCAPDTASACQKFRSISNDVPLINQDFCETDNATYLHVQSYLGNDPTTRVTLLIDRDQT